MIELKRNNIIIDLLTMLFLFLIKILNKNVSDFFTQVTVTAII